MIKSFSIFLLRISNWKNFLVFFVLYLFFVGYVFEKAVGKIDALAGNKVGVIDLSFGYNPEKTMEMVAAYGDKARAFYTSVELTVDLIYPPIYALILSILISQLFRYKSYLVINILPFIAVIFDFAENLNIILLLNIYPQQSVFLAILCEIFKLLKWITIGVSILLILYGFIIKMLQHK